MGLKDLRTNLKDLKFGNDEYQGGNSGQPFIQTRIPATDEPLQTGFSNAGPVLAGIGAGAAIGAIGGSILGSTGAGAAIGAAAGLGLGLAGANVSGDGFRLPSAGTGGPDFLIRGGYLLPGIIANDTIRLTKFFASTEGILFTVKQNLLSRISVRTQASKGILNDGIYTPISTLLEAAGVAFGIHVNKQGLDPFGDEFYAKTISNEINDALQSPDLKHYGLASNRLYGLYATKVGQFDNPLIPFYVKNNIAEDPYGLLAYQGGPGSDLGIGKTRINYATTNAGAPLSVVNHNASDSDSIISFITLNNNQLNEISDSVGSVQYPTTVDFRKKLKIDLSKPQTIISNAPSYDSGENKTLEQRVNLGDPGNKSGKNLSSYTSGVTTNSGSAFYGAASKNSYDKINASVIYQSEGPQGTNNPNPDALNNDLVKFRIGVISNDSPKLKTYIHFRAFLDQINDNYDSSWNMSKYIGRGENFYTYGGFDRRVSLSWTIAAQSKAELIPMYKRLNYLASICAPDYSKAGYMRGNIVTLTIGGYFYEQPGIITGLSYTMNDENSSWEIGINDIGASDRSVKELPHMIKVSSFNFIPIHTFVPRLQQNEFDSTGNKKAFLYGNERYIALASGIGNDHNNYDN